MRSPLFWFRDHQSLFQHPLSSISPAGVSHLINSILKASIKLSSVMSSGSSSRVVVRRAKKAGSWYEKNARLLDQQLTDWLRLAGPADFYPAKAIISPHAGLIYSGSCAAHAFKELSPEVSRIFIVGPSHYVNLPAIALSPASVYQTPLGDLTVDRAIYDELYGQHEGLFREMTLDVDEAEHSLELQLPFVFKVMETRTQPVTIVPMMVGNLSEESNLRYAQALAPYMKRPENAFVISSDFCHWGHRFDYQFYDKSWGDIHESIERLDKLAMKSIKHIDCRSFESYLKSYKNTICGRNPIRLMIRMAQLLNEDPQEPNYKIKFLNYKQSSKCRNMNDSSVSYVAASLKQFPSDHPLTPVDDIVDV